MLFRPRADAGPSPAGRARLASLLGAAAPPPAPPAAPPAAGVAEPPEPLEMGRRGAAALAVLALAAVAATGFVVWRGRPQPVEVAPPRVEVSAPPAAPATLVVHVTGDVRKPGLVRLPPGARVADALDAAGGLLPKAALAGLNLARKVVDGEQIAVGVPVAAAAPGSAAAPAGGPVNLNLATAEDLDALPGIGPVLADRIVEWRTAHGPFSSVDQLREVSGIGARKFESLRELVTV